MTHPLERASREGKARHQAGSELGATVRAMALALPHGVCPKHRLNLLAVIATTPLRVERKTSLRMGAISEESAVDLANRGLVKLLRTRGIQRAHITKLGLEALKKQVNS
jgi:hypothetical protein